MLTIILVGVGSGALGYAAWYISQLKAGLVATPRRPWRVRPADGGVAIDTASRATTVPEQDI